MSKPAITIRDIAKAAGVSKSSVSAALTGNGRIAHETKVMILRAADEMGFEPNVNAVRLQKKGISDLIGLFTLDLDVSVGTRKIQEIRYALARRNSNVQIHSCGYQHEAAARELRTLAKQRPCAIICNTTDLPPDALNELRIYQENGGIVVCYDRPVNVECDLVEFDRADNTCQAARHLLQLGHRRLGYFQIGKDLSQSRRLTGFRTALGEFGLEANPAWLFESLGLGEFEYDGEKMAEYFLGLKERPTAVCIVNDFAAMAFIALVQRAGLSVPHDVAVVGHDNRPMCNYCSVPLTSVSQPTEIIAEKVVELLFDRLENGPTSPFRREIVRGELVVRASSGASI